jgi:hypothetical protein
MLRHLRFTIRDLFWLTLVVALAASWGLDRRLLLRRHAAEKEAILQETAEMIHEATNNFDR